MIYLDNAATTRASQAAINAMLPYLTEDYGNPSVPNISGAKAAKALKDARARLAMLIGASPEEIIFTSGGTEANNQAIATAVGFALQKRKKRFIISEIEHDSVYKAVKRLENQDFDIITVKPDSGGCIAPKEIERHINEDTAFVSVMTANNELGTIQPISEIGEICRNNGILFHTDGVQAAGHICINVKDLNVDMFSLSAHKFGGIKGIGALYVRKGIPIQSMLVGGNQEHGYRAGTEPVPLITAMAAALEDSLQGLTEKQEKTAFLRNTLETILSEIPDSIINGRNEIRLPGHLNISFKGINSDTLILMLDESGICVSKGAACHSGEETPGRVLTATGLRPDYALGTIRFSLSYENTKEEIEFAAQKLKESITALRK